MSIVIDALHTLNLGVYQTWCLFSLWGLVNKNAWGLSENFSAKEIRILSCEYIRSELTAYYAHLRSSRPGIDITEITHFAMQTIGGDKGRVLRTKAAETKFLL